MRVQANLPGPSLSLYNLFLHMHKKKILFLEKEGQSDEAQHLKWCHSLENNKIYKTHYSFLRQLSPFPRYKHVKYLKLKIDVKVTEYNMYNDAL